MVAARIDRPISLKRCTGLKVLLLVQAMLEGQQAALKLKLKQALRLHTLPRTHVDIATVADKAVALLDGLLEVGIGGLPLPSLHHLHVAFRWLERLS